MICAHAGQLDLGRVVRHHDDGLHAQHPRRPRHTLAVIAGAGGDHPFGTFPSCQMLHPIQRAAQLEGARVLQMLTFQMELEVILPEGRRRRRVQNVGRDCRARLLDRSRQFIQPAQPERTISCL